MVNSTHDENWAKRRLKKILDSANALHIPISSSGMGVSGVSDRLCCLNGIFIAVEAKRPGRRGEANRGASALQVRFLNDVAAHHGISIVFDGEDDDVDMLERVLTDPALWRGFNNLNEIYWKKK